MSKIAQPMRTAELGVWVGFSLIPKPGFFLPPHSLLSRVGIERKRDEWHLSPEDCAGVPDRERHEEEKGARGVERRPAGTLGPHSRAQAQGTGPHTQPLGTSAGWTV